MKGYFISRALVGLLITILSLVFSAGAIAAGLSIYVSPSGDDANDGLSATKALVSLQRALDVALATPEESATSVRILVAEGSYLKQTAATKGLPGGREMQIRPLNNDSPRPQFDGGGNGGTWLTLRSAAGNPSKIGVYGLEIVNYKTAISLNGNRDDTAKWNGENVIRNNVFKNIGQIARDGGKPSTAAIRLVNSDRNTIFRNKFINIRNRERCALLHAIYVAHDSTDNVIEENTFEDGCGDAIRFRDASHRNIVRGNRFVDAWDKAPVSDWYCESEKRNDCTKLAGECPSINNVLENNQVVPRKIKGVPLSLTYGADAPLQCGKLGKSDFRFIVK